LVINTIGFVDVEGTPHPYLIPVPSLQLVLFQFYKCSRAAVNPEFARNANISEKPGCNSGICITD